MRREVYLRLVVSAEERTLFGYHVRLCSECTALRVELALKWVMTSAGF